MSAVTGKWDARFQGPVPHDLSYYSKCMLGGALACGTTHAGITPLDVAKCNMQVNPTKYTGLGSALSTISKEAGGGLWKGFGPTFVGYSLQGMFKYGLYEVFKDAYMNLAGEELSNKYKPAIWLAGSATAEVFADVALCPLEMTKVKIQTSPNGTFPVAFGAALKQMSATKAETRYPFGSLVPLWSRQIPYTMAKFFFFEKIVQLFYTHVFTAPKETYSKTTQLGVTFASGYLAGVVCAVVSHPADSLVSLLGKAENKGKSAGQIVSEVGFSTLATKGLGTRVIMIGTLTGFQWWIYDTFKSTMGLGTTGGK
ncbi:mitochondrial carrier protein [Schizophyllum commune H4-8]|uniref:Mitochondrial carrier protein n=1 Tax=Schizophyllum commune (strain H4-8 / FGSC 9210) TaxID=578458 RepID=D8Q0N9_SCHCM|nr:mitochondrial carrier protein [Schizophyllum commune H4-8]KAI5895085.1 mitochondrial carrier protein [Schizophyllum commune H4-8]